MYRSPRVVVIVSPLVLATSQVAGAQFGPDSFSKHPAVAIAAATTNTSVSLTILPPSSARGRFRASTRPAVQVARGGDPSSGSVWPRSGWRGAESDVQARSRGLEAHRIGLGAAT